MGNGDTTATRPVSGRSLGYVKLNILGCMLAGSILLWKRFGMEMIFRPQRNVEILACLSSARTSQEFDWNKLVPSKELRWVPCYGTNRECARLEVPLDYHDDSAGYAAVALLRIPAKTSGENYRGPILFNPGGPGGSGVDFINEMGSHFQLVLGDEYDIVGFDPRGIGHTTPVVDIFDTPLQRGAWDLRNYNAPYMNETNTALSQIIARFTLVNKMVAEKAGLAAQHMNTAVVARDMLSITRAHGFDKLKYWGFSYGSVLGSTFASLYPDKVDRLVIDGVVDANNYYQGRWDNNLIKADESMNIAFDQCAESGSACPLYESTAEQVNNRYLQIVESVKQNPVTVHHAGTMAIIMRKHVHYGLLWALYEPYIRMKTYFGALRALEWGDGVPMYLFTEPVQVQPVRCDCSPAPPMPVGGPESGASVRCSDGPGVENDPEELYRHYEKLANMSYVGDIGSEVRMRCVGSKVKAKWQWRGPIGGNTSFPLLLVGNMADPVTPYAEKMSKLFQDSAVLIQNSTGHCSLTATSLCTVKAVREYFRRGILPAKGTVCEIEDHIFLNRTISSMEMVNEEDERILGAWRALKGRLPHISLLHGF